MLIIFNLELFSQKGLEILRNIVFLRRFSKDVP